MVAVIKTGTSISRAFHYNERKVEAGVAECLKAANYPMDAEDMTRSNKLNMLLHQAALNKNVTCNSVHISLNFAPSEKLTPECLGEIADTYMDKIGFGEQPYLVYQHHDAGHPHVHIVSLCVRADGSRIPLHNIGRNQSEKARKEIEISCGLVKASGKSQGKGEEIKPVPPRMVQYGRTETKQAIAQVLDAVVKNFHYTSLPELNAVLRHYQIMADPGTEKSRVHQHHGLTYSALDGDGKKIGVPIKASDFPNKPTLKYLERKFRVNEELRQPHKTRVRNAIDLALLKQPNHSMQSLIAALEKEGIYTARRETAAGMIYGLTYIDYKTKCVFNGSDLGKSYSAKGLQERCRQEETVQSQTGFKASVEALQTQSNSGSV
ncbi:MAG: relaxase/mobilization nuclease domain-containing protein [Adhaeribacter sp.]